MSGVVSKSWQGTAINILMVALIGVVSAVGSMMVKQLDSIEGKITKVEDGHKKDKDLICADLKAVCDVIHTHDKEIDRIKQRMDDHLKGTVDPIYQNGNRKEAH